MLGLQHCQNSENPIGSSPTILAISGYSEVPISEPLEAALLYPPCGGIGLSLEAFGFDAPIDWDLGYPPISGALPVNANRMLTPCGRSLISSVETLRHATEILKPIVGRIAVDVVDD